MEGGGKRDRGGDVEQVGEVEVPEAASIDKQEGVLCTCSCTCMHFSLGSKYTLCMDYRRYSIINVKRVPSPPLFGVTVVTPY